MSEPTCPRCGSSRVYREIKRVKRSAYHRVARPSARCKTCAGWYVCTNCWYKFDGITNTGDGVLPPGVVARGKPTVQVTEKAE